MGFRFGKGKVLLGFRCGFFMGYGVSVGVEDGDYVIFSWVLDFFYIKINK